MIQANELRIGNSVARKSNGSRCIVTTYLIDDIERGRHDYKPIPLTEEWLERFGCSVKKVESKNFFTLDADKWQYYHIWKVMPKMVANKAWAFRILNKEGKEYELYSIKHVHQLQNLYFALTGTELEPKG